MKELFNVFRKDSGAVHRLMATILEEGLANKTLIYDNEIMYCAGAEDFYKENLDEISEVRTTGVYDIAGKEVYCEVLEKTPELIVCGAGHVGAACIRFATALDMRVTCIEDRQDFADIATEMGAHKVICDKYDTALERIEGGENVYFLTMTRAHAFDEVCLEKILRKQFAYVGMLGSAAKINKIRTDLEEMGVSGEQFDKVHTPVGLDIKAITPEEIAIAVMAEIISVKNTASTANDAFTHEQLDAIAADKGHPILATLIRKHMSSPREPGTKMLITSDGEKYGTIGGGLAEAEARRTAAENMDDESFVNHVAKVGDDSTAADGSICGGVVDVLFERIV